MGEGGEGGLPSANPDNVAAGGVTDARCGGERGERRGGMGQITAHSNPHSSFSLSFFPLCVRQGFDEKVLLSAVQYTSAVVTGDNCSPVSLILAKNLLLVSLSPAIIFQQCQQHR